MQSRFIRYFIAASFAVGIPVSLQAATFTPNVFDDPTPNPAPNGCSNAGANPNRCSLREASLSANANTEPDIIVLAAGTYQLTRPEGGSETGDLLFVQLDGVNNIAIQGAGSSETILEASAGLNSRLIQFSGSSGAIDLSGFTVKNGGVDQAGGGIFFGMATVEIKLQDLSFEGNRSIGMNGGGLFVGGGQGSLILNNVNFTDNSAAEGGGLYVDIGQGEISIDGGTYDGNEADENGGAIRFAGSTDEASDLFEVRNAVITNNKAFDGNGGGIYHSTGGGLSLVNVQVTGNSAANPGNDAGQGSGGGVYASNGGQPIVAQFIDSNISGNSAAGNTIETTQGGGGIFTGGSGGTRIVNSTLADNQANGGGNGGGGIFLSGGSNSGLEILNSTISGNHARNGGGIFHQNGGNGSLRQITNSTISGNSSVRAGGGAYIERSGTGFSLNNVTVAGNSAGTVGGGLNSIIDPLILRNSIFGGNSAADGLSADCSGSSYESDGFNIFAGSGNSDCTPDGVAVGGNPDDILADPLIGALADNGGPTLTQALLEGSPALNAGNPGGCVDGAGAALDSDQRGFARPAGTECDIGAVETSVTDLAIVKTADDEVYVVGDQITYTLTATNNGPDESRVLLSDVLPTAVTFVSADAPCVEASGTVTCDLGSVAAGDSVAVNVIVGANDDGVVDNTATVSGADIETDPANDSSTVSVNVLSDAVDGGGCKLGGFPSDGSFYGWSLLGSVLLLATLLRRRKI